MDKVRSQNGQMSTPKKQAIVREGTMMKTSVVAYGMKRNSWTSCPWRHYLLQKPKMSYNLRPETDSFRDARYRQMG